MYDGIPYHKQRAGERGTAPGHHSKNMEKSQHTDFNEDTTNESASVARIATYGCVSWTLRKNEETRLDGTPLR